MVYNIHVKDFFERSFYILNPGIAKFNYLAGFGEYNVIVLFEFVRFFELSDVVTELMLSYQIARQQQVHGIVQSGPAHPVILVFHIDKECFNVEMTRAVVYFIEDREALGRFTVTVFFEVGRENLLYTFLGRFAHHSGSIWCVKGTHILQRLSFQFVQWFEHHLPVSASSSNR